MTRGVRGISVGYPLRYPLRGVVYPLGLKILLIVVMGNGWWGIDNPTTTHLYSQFSKILREV